MSICPRIFSWYSCFWKWGWLTIYKGKENVRTVRAIDTLSLDVKGKIRLNWPKKRAKRLKKKKKVSYLFSTKIMHSVKLLNYAPMQLPISSLRHKWENLKNLSSILSKYLLFVLQSMAKVCVKFLPLNLVLMPMVKV